MTNFNRITHMSNSSFSLAHFSMAPLPFQTAWPVANMVWDTSQIYMAAWAKSKYDYQMDRLFNSWYYEI